LNHLTPVNKFNHL